jgi:hypothetical protein
LYIIRGRGRGGRGRGRGRGRGHRGGRGYNQRGRFDNYYSEKSYDRPYKKPYRNNEEEWDNPDVINKNREEYGYGAQKEKDEDDMSFPEYKPPQVQYRGGARRGASNQGMKGRTDRGRFSYFTSSHDT